MKQSSRINYLRQLCSLQVAGSALMPVVIAQVSELLGSDMCCFNWLTDQGELSHAHTVGLLPSPEVVQRYTQQYVNRAERELGVTTRELAGRPAQMVGSRSLGARFLHTVLFNDILQPMGLRYILSAGVFVDGRMVGTLACNRMSDQAEFSASDTRQLAHVLPYLALACTQQEAADTPWSEEDERGALIVNMQGAICHADGLGLHRLYRATHNAASHVGANMDELMSRPLRLLTQRIAAIEAGTASLLPDMTLVSDGRRFTLKARSLRTSPHQPLDRVLISIGEWIPTALKTLPWLQAQGLSARQRELALLMSQGASLPEAALRLGVSRHTASSYLDIIYAKLGVNNREALRVQLLCASAVKAPLDPYAAGA